jgi:hypothetical protein
VFPENQGPGREKFTFVDFGGGDRCRRHLIDLTVTGEVKTLYNCFLCCLTNLHAVFSPGNPVDKPTLVGLSVGTSVYRRDFPTSVSPVSVYRSERRFMGGVSYTQSPVGGSRVGLSVGSSVCRRGFLSVSVYRWGFLTSLKAVCMLGKTRFETV